MAVGAIIGAIWVGISTITGKLWTATKDLISYLFDVMPKPLKFFVFLYMIVFVISSIMPVFLGVGNSCDSYGNAYKIGFLDLQMKSNYVNAMANVCSGVQDTETEFGSFVNSLNFGRMLERIYVTVKRTWGIWSSVRAGNYNNLDPECAEFRELNYTNSTVTRDIVLQEWGTKVNQVGYENIVHIGCSQDRNGDYFPSLQFYTLDLFNFEMWLLIGIAGALIPFALTWYRTTLKR